MPGRLYNSLKVLHHHDRLADLGEGRLPPPISVRLKPTNVCNHHCAYCTYGRGLTANKSANRDQVAATDRLSRAKLMELIDDLAQIGVRAVTFSGGGEPLTHPDIHSAAQEVRRKGLDMALISNGQLLQNELAVTFADAAWVRISFDSPEPSEYAKIRNIPERSWYEVCDNMASFARIKNPDCVLGVNFVVGRDNYRRIYQAAGLVKELGADNIKFSALVDNRPDYHEGIKDEALRQLDKAVSELADDGFSIIAAYCQDHDYQKRANHQAGRCRICRLATVVGADGKIYLCHTRAYDSRAEIGDITERPFREVWFAAATAARLADLEPARDCLNFCVYEGANMALEQYLNINRKHVNFI